MEGIIAQHDFLNVRQFYIAVRRLADSLSYGTDHSPWVGSGIEYVQSRPYVAGDSVRSIDWRVTARTRKVHVKEYESPKRMPVYILLDTSASMTVSSTARSKYELAVFIAGGLAMACLDRISPVGLLGTGGSALHVRPSLSRDQILGWLHKLRRYRFDEPTQLASRIAQLDPSLAQRTMIIVLSDLHDTAALGALKRLGQRHDCAVLQLRDAAETSLRGAGLLRVQEAETGRELVAHGRTRWHDPARVADELRRSAIDHMVIDVDRPYVPQLRQFFKSRDILGRGAR
ncbi:MAG: DUF58 domain-containing protein [Pirellulales bacterium]